MLVVRQWGLAILDPLLSMGIVVFMLSKAFLILQKTLHILMQGTPLHIHLEALKRRLEEIEGVKNVHHLHLWSLNEEEHYAELHVVTDYSTLKEVDTLRLLIVDVLHREFGIRHNTIQFECSTCEDESLIVRE
ncbi:MAG: cation transporter dimerization domain-containing protein [Candidatus Caldatribacteriaceae bacterium]